MRGLVVRLIITCWLGIIGNGAGISTVGRVFSARLSPRFGLCSASGRKWALISLLYKLLLYLIIPIVAYYNKYKFL